MKSSESSIVRSNIWKLYAIQALTQALFAIPIIVLFWRSHGLNLQQILLLQAAFAATILFLEIPTGYIADRWGRKQTIVAGCFFGFLAYFVYATSTNFWQFFLAEIIIGIGASLLSGSMEAVTYDTLLELGEEKTYRRVAGNQSFWEFNTEAVSSLIGAALATISVALPMWVTILPMGAALMISFSLHEPKSHRPRTDYRFRAVWNVSTNTLVHHRGLRSIILLHGVLSAMTLTFFWFFQSYQTLVGLPVWLFGITHATTVFAGAYAARTASRLEKQVDDRLLLIGIAIVVVGSFLALGLSPTVWLLGAFLVSRIAWGALGPVTADMVNRMTTSDVRATVLSLRSLFGRFIFVCTSPFVGGLADARSISVALPVAGAIGACVLLIIFLSIRSVWKEIPA